MIKSKFPDATGNFSKRWERFSWELTASGLDCTFEHGAAIRVEFDRTQNPRTFSIRIQSSRFFSVKFINSQILPFSRTHNLHAKVNVDTNLRSAVPLVFEKFAVRYHDICIEHKNTHKYVFVDLPPL